MLGGLQARIVGGFVLVILLTLIVAGIVFFSLLGSYQRAIDRATLVLLADQVAFGLSEFSTGNVSPADLGRYLRAQSEETGALVFVLDQRGRVVRDLSPGSEYENLELPVTLQEVDQSHTAYVEGHVVAENGARISYLAGLLPLVQFEHGAFIAIALRDDAGSNIGADLVPRLLLSGLVGLAVSLLVALWVGRSLYNPLQRVTSAVRAVGSGNYETRVPEEDGADEVQDLARAFNRMTSQVQRNQETLQDFMADVSHELRTPLTSIRGFTQALLDGTVQDDERRARSVEVIDDEARRMLRLVEGMLDLSRIQAGQLQLRPEPVDPAELVTHVAEVFRPRAEESGIALSVEAPEGIPHIRCDFDRLVQVIANLVDNAIRHTTAGSVTLEARHEGRSVELRVADTGEGIAAQDLPRLFERFFRGEASGRRRGTGLGLAIAREIIRAHGGEITASSEPGIGTTFRIALPPADKTLGPLA